MTADSAYRGWRDPSDGSARIRRLPADRELHPSPSRQLAAHSDTFDWGYSGSGPAQLSLALLLDYYESSRIALAHYQQFKTDLITTIPHSASRWQLPATAIEQIVEPMRKSLMDAGHTTTSPPV